MRESCSFDPTRTRRADPSAGIVAVKAAGTAAEALEPGVSVIDDSPIAKTWVAS